LENGHTDRSTEQAGGESGNGRSVSSVEQLKDRTKNFAIEVIKVVQSMPKDRTSEILAKQLVRAATSVGANYRSACRARSKADFISKISIVEEEADEVQYWMELVMSLNVLPDQQLARLYREASELTAIFTASRQTAKRNSRRWG